MPQTVFHIEKMDCPIEEQLIRKRLERMEGVENLRFNLMERELAVSHRLEDDAPLLAALEDLGMEPRRGGAEAARQTRFRIPDMCCPSEVEMIRGALGKRQDVEDIDASVMERRVTVRH